MGKMRHVHRHDRPMPTRKRYDETLMLWAFQIPVYPWVQRPDFESNHLDLERKCDEMDNEGDE